MTTVDNCVVFHNMKAVSSMARGDHKGCTTELESALHAFRGLLGVAGNVQEHQAQPDRHHRPVISIQSVQLPDCPSVVSSQFGYNPLTLFHKAFVVVNKQEEDPMGGTSSNEGVDADMMLPGSEHAVPSVLLYNMALSFHTEGIRKGSAVAMARAYEFYRHSVLLLERAGIDAVQQGRGRTLLLAALANNMAHVSASLFHHNRTRASCGRRSHG